MGGFKFDLCTPWRLYTLYLPYTKGRPITVSTRTPPVPGASAPKVLREEPTAVFTVVTSKTRIRRLRGATAGEVAPAALHGK